MTSAALLFLALALSAAVLDWIAVHREQRALELVCKPLTLVLLIGAALALDAELASMRAWFIVALVFSLAGDVLLMLHRRLFVFGLGAFLVGHLGYIVGLQVHGVDGTRFLAGALAAIVAMAVVGRVILRGVRRGDEPDLAGPVAAYMVVISAMLASAVGTGRWLAAAGAASFYVSDALIAWNRFVREVRHAPVGIMVTYHAAQLLLVLSLI